jgi:hypothetical protein
MPARPPISAKRIAQASPEDRANAVQVLGAEFIFAAFFEPPLSF